MAEKQKPGFVVTVVVWAVLAAVLYGCFFTGEPRIKTAAEIQTEKVLRAYIRCENETKNRIADRDGIRFASQSEWVSKWSVDTNKVTFNFQMVARNAYGALVPAQMQCSAAYDGEYWTVTDVSQQ